MAAKALRLHLGNQMGRIWRGYERMLQRRPVLTQASTSAVLWATGDVLAQKLEGLGKEVKPPLDPVRAVQTGGFGAGLVGPVGHFWYLGLDKLAASLFVPGSKRFIAAKVGPCPRRALPGPAALGRRRPSAAAGAAARAASSAGSWPVTVRRLLRRRQRPSQAQRAPARPPAGAAGQRVAGPLLRGCLLCVR
jgi:hypothetical protein